MAKDNYNPLRDVDAVSVTGSTGKRRKNIRAIILTAVIATILLLALAGWIINKIINTVADGASGTTETATVAPLNPVPQAPSNYDPNYVPDVGQDQPMPLPYPVEPDQPIQPVQP